MPEDQDRKITPSKGSGFFSDLGIRIKLILRLLADSRINPIIKLLPLGSLVYLIIPDIAPGPIDDALVIWLGAYLFIELCPPDVVQEHMQALTNTIPGEWHDPLDDDDEDVIDAEFHIDE